MFKEMRDRMEATAADLGLKCCWGEQIEPGDMYLVQRNRPYPVLLTCKVNVRESGYISPVEFGEYCFDTNECVKVVEIN